MKAAPNRSPRNLLRGTHGWQSGLGTSRRRLAACHGHRIGKESRGSLGAARMLAGDQSGSMNYDKAMLTKSQNGAGEGSPGDPSRGLALNQTHPQREWFFSCFVTAHDSCEVSTQDGCPD
jgi:hypothetical protein